MLLIDDLDTTSASREDGNDQSIRLAFTAGALGVTRKQLNVADDSAHVVSPQMAQRLEKAFGGSAAMWMRIQAAYDAAITGVETPRAIA